MKLKDKTVNIYGLHPMIQIANAEANWVWGNYDQELVVTSAIDGKHGTNSLHAKGRACDYRTFYFVNDAQVSLVALDLRDALGDDYDVIVESDHMHVEYDPQNPKII